MRSKFAAGALSALIYFQGLLGFAGVATVLLKEHAADTAYHDSLPRTGTTTAL